MPEQHPVYVIRAVLRGTEPPVWRRIAVPANMKLPRLHDILQAAFGWSGDHLHEFVLRDIHYQSMDRPARAVGGVPYERVGVVALLPTVGAQAGYVYDLGEEWDHALVLERVLPRGETPDRPVCLDGARACPPDNCGGIGGYEAVLDAVRGRENADRAEMLDWLGSYDPEAFDPDEINRRWGWNEGTPRWPEIRDLPAPEKLPLTELTLDDIRERARELVLNLDAPHREVPEDWLRRASLWRLIATPALMAILEDSERCLELVRFDHDIPFYAMYLLAEFREKKASAP